MKTLGNFLLVKEMITELVVCQIVLKENYKIIAIDLIKQLALDSDPRAIQQNKFITNLDRSGNAKKFFIIEGVKETVLDFSLETV